MARSRRKPVIKDKPRNYKRTSAYWRPIRRIWKQMVNSFGDYDDKRGRFGYWEFDDSLPSGKTIINDYDYCDSIWRYDLPFMEDCKEEINKFSRK